MFNGFKNVHFIGIGGAGMSAIAYVLLNRGYRVSGSDLNNGHMINKVMSSGAIIYNKHAESDLDGVELIVISTAIHADTIEFKKAKRRGLPI